MKMPTEPKAAITIPYLGSTAGDADLCREYGIPEVSLNQDLAATTAAQEATLLALAVMPGQRFEANNAGGIMRQALGIEKYPWNNSLTKLSSLAIVSVAKASQSSRRSRGLKIELPMLLVNSERKFYTPRLDGVLDRMQEQGVLSKKLPLGIKSRRGDRGAAALTIEPPVAPEEMSVLEQAGIVRPDRWLELKGKQAKRMSAFSFTPGELGDQPSETMAQTAFLIATVLGSNRGAITIDGEPHDPNKTRGWGLAPVDSPHNEL